jgi:hypothetical protein
MGFPRSDEARREDGLYDRIGSLERTNSAQAKKITELEQVAQIKCPKCESIHVAVSHTPLCGSPGEKVMVFWAVCNEMECRQQFHVLYDLVPAKFTKLNKERWLKL